MHGRLKGGQGEPWPLLDFEIISKKRLFFQFIEVKTKFHHFWPPLVKILGKSLLVPPGKNPFDVHGWMVCVSRKPSVLLSKNRHSKRLSQKLHSLGVKITKLFCRHVQNFATTCWEFYLSWFSLSKRISTLTSKLPTKYQSFELQCCLCFVICRRSGAHFVQKRT